MRSCSARLFLQSSTFRWTLPLLSQLKYVTSFHDSYITSNDTSSVDEIDIASQNFTTGFPTLFHNKIPNEKNNDPRLNVKHDSINRTSAVDEGHGVDTIPLTSKIPPAEDTIVANVKQKRKPRSVRASRSTDATFEDNGKKTDETNKIRRRRRKIPSADSDGGLSVPSESSKSNVTEV
ncbi:unnamed protein product [Phytomonas sp. Hart1]|nr:unnamed protein product [Phytomonas sp. Hart1]|eukprot:CCW67220.1 unnamed protein product [Phytomonas sp. isolate Hart1]